MSDEITNLDAEEKEALGITDEPEEANNTEVEAEETKSEETKEEEKSEDKTEDEQESEESEDEESEEEVEDVEEDDSAPRQPLVPYKKFKEERTKRKELEEKINTLQEDLESLKLGTKTPTQQNDDIEKLAEEHGIDPEFVKKLSNQLLAKAKSPLSDDEIAEWKAQQEVQKQHELFESEFEELLSEKPEATAHKKELHQLAFSPKYSGKNFKSLFEIFVREVEPNVSKKKTIESSNKKSDGSVLDYENMTEAEALKLPDEKFLEWDKYQAQKSKN